jgi:hypothetical protein
MTAPAPPAFRTDALLAALETQMRRDGIGWREMARRAGLRSYSIGGKLRRGAQPTAGVLIRLLGYLGDYDLARYLPCNHDDTGISRRRAQVLAAAIREELMDLWHDLSWAVEYAHDGCWSMQCESLAGRIVELSRLVGPTSWEHIQVKLLRSGVYERVYDEAGIAYPPIDRAEVEALHERIQAGLLTAAAGRPR